MYNERKSHFYCYLGTMVISSREIFKIAWSGAKSERKGHAERAISSPVLHVGSCASGELYFIGLILANFTPMFHCKRAVKRYLVLSRCRRKKSAQRMQNMIFDIFTGRLQSYPAGLLHGNRPLCT